jgi:hypothetical protein
MIKAWRSVFRLKGLRAGGRGLAFLLLALLVPGMAGAATGAWKWPTDKPVPVCWTNPVDEKSKYYADEQRRMKLVKDAVNDNYGRFSALRFSGWGKCAAGSEANSIQVRIMWTKQRDDKGPNGKTNPQAYLGHQTIIEVQTGKDGEARPGMYLDFDSGEDYTVSSALHEFGHALGYEHDHQQKDKADFVCKELHPSVKTDKPDPKPQYMADKRDSQSIMSYCPVFKQFWRSITADDVRGLQKDYGAGSGGPLTKAGVGTGSVDCAKKFPAGDGDGAAFLHLTDGNCWACPRGYNRTMNPDVAGKSACERPGGERHAKATREGAPTGAFKTDCGRGEFLDIGTGRCYSCPDGYNRSAAPITASNACSKAVKADLDPAKRKGPAGCPQGSFADGLSGQCYTCGENHDRTLDPVTASTACIRKDWGLGRRIFF